MTPETPHLPREPLSANFQEFLADYEERISTPLNILNHIGIVAFPSDPEIVQMRIDAMSGYFNDPNDPTYRWGGTIFAEPISRDILQTALYPVLKNRGLSLQLATTSMDHSVADHDYYQKGCDLCVVREDEPYRPLCGVDVTLGGNKIIKFKRNKPGFQETACMPVLVLPLNDLTFDYKRNGRGHAIYNFGQYLSSHARQAVQRGISIDNFYGLSHDETVSWKKKLAHNLDHAAKGCRSSLKKDGHHIRTYPYKQEIFDLLDEMDGIIDQYGQQVKQLS